MNKERAKIWTSILRSDMYSKAIGRLGSANTNQRCCLGVACDIAVMHGVIPPPIINSDTKEIKYIGEAVYLPSAVRMWLEIGNFAGDIVVEIANTTFTISLPELNDSGDALTFSQIADVIDFFVDDL